MSVFLNYYFASFLAPKPDRRTCFAEDERWRGACDKEMPEKARWWNSGGQETQED